jgi:hypothetical protein
VLTFDEMLDNVMLYWVTGAGASSARFYWESFRRPFLGPVHVPAGCSIFPKEIFRPSRRWAERQLPKLHASARSADQKGQSQDRDWPVSWVGDTGIEPVTSSV